MTRYILTSAVETLCLIGAFAFLSSDNGRGFNLPVTDEGATLGLSNMRFRAECTGGTISIDSHPGSGTSISLTVPIV